MTATGKRSRSTPQLASTTSAPFTRQSRGVIGIAIALIYLATAQLSHTLLFNSEPTPIWPAAGLAVVAVLWYKRWGVIGIAIGDLAFGLLNQQPPFELILTVAVILQAMLGAWCLQSLDREQALLTRPRDTIGLFLLVTFASTLINATLSTGLRIGLQRSLLAASMSTDAELQYNVSEWLQFWLGDSMGILIVVPLLLTVSRVWPILRDRRYEAGLCFGGMVVLSTKIFMAAPNTLAHQYSAHYFLFPFVVWAALRLGLPGATLSSCLASVIAILGTAAGRGPFTIAAGNFDRAILSLQLFVTVLTITALILATSEAQRQLIERQRTSLMRYFSPTVANQLVEQDTRSTFHQRQNVAVLYADIFGFTSLVEGMAPEAILSLLREFYQRMEAQVFAHDGMLQEYTGDSLMAVFGAPKPGSQDATNALMCARAMVQELNAYNLERTVTEQNLITMGIGIAYGSAVMGDIGQDRNMAFMVVGKVTKLAVRLMGLCLRFNADIILTKAVQDVIKREQSDHSGLFEDFIPIGKEKLLGLSESISLVALPSHRRIPDASSVEFNTEQVDVDALCGDLPPSSIDTLDLEQPSE
jgi:class 3 adenylate cyclase